MDFLRLSSTPRSISPNAVGWLLTIAAAAHKHTHRHGNTTYFTWQAPAGLTVIEKIDFSSVSETISLTAQLNQNRARETAASLFFFLYLTGVG